MQVPSDVYIYIYRCCVVCLLLQVLIEEEVEWMAPSDSGIPTLEEMLTWKVIGPVSSCTLNMCLRANILSMIIYSFINTVAPLPQPPTPSTTTLKTKRM